ncbi:PREDICTED: probable ATP-dependent RNA helicase DDX47 [Acropora digitifera]|uniref:probable ATP-dependent RNA helicase DDX47 n=1 Tax=Acropora digitifera TaxID=70779 RepID=UPI00077A18D2|nr:PREDICTED: probable ATP-dependent RNA helicase DDX47 [Acropora digitifera]
MAAVGESITEEKVTFESLGVIDVLCEACQQLGWKTPTKIQREAIPVALEEPLSFQILQIDTILKVIPRERRTYLYSATMTKKVQKLQRASLQDPVKVEVATKYTTVEKLQQSYLFIPNKYKVRNFFVSIGLGLSPGALGALNKFKSKDRSVLIATDVASRGLDIPHVDVVINFDIPTHSKDYIHRVGRTARAGRSGRSITFVTQYDVELYQRIEQLIGKKLPLYPTVEDEVLVLMERVMEAQRTAKIGMREMDEKKKNKRRMEDDDEESQAIKMPSRKMKFAGLSKKKKRRN